MKKRILKIISAAIIILSGCDLFVPDPPDEEAPAAPAGLELVSYSYNYVAVQWNDNSDNEDGFTIQRCTDGLFLNGCFEDILSADTESYTDDSVDQGQLYYYRVFASGSGKDSDVSNVIDVTTAVLTIPDTPDEFSVSDIDYNYITLDWNDNSDNEDNFILLRSLDGSFASPETFTLDANLETYTDNSVDPETQYYYRIYSENTAGSSAGYAETDGETLADPATIAPLAPDGFSASEIEYNYITLIWNDNSNNENNFILLKSPDGSFSAPEIITVDPDLETYTDSLVDPLTHYYYRVYAANLIGDSDYAETDAETPEDPFLLAPAAPDNAWCISSSDRAVFIKWNDNADTETDYRIQRASDSGFSSYDEYIIDPDSVYFRDKNGITPETDYWYRAAACNVNGYSEFSEIIEVTTGSVITVPPDKRIADHTVTGLVKNGEIPISAIEEAKNELHIGYGHTSHGSQIASGMSGLNAFANAGNCDGVYSYSSEPNLFLRSSSPAADRLHLYEGDGYGNGDLDHDCGNFSTGYTQEEYIAAVQDYIDGNATSRPTNWYYETRIFLGDPDVNGRGSNNPDFNVIIWSWCGQAEGKSESNMHTTYLDPMQALEDEYPGIVFVYMTGHLGYEGDYHYSNDFIRNYCEANNKWLFDFADIESYDPDGIFYTIGTRTSDDGLIYDFNENDQNEFHSEVYPDNGDRNWGFDWQDEHIQNTDWYDCGAAHSVSINANMKAYAVWWLWCRIAEEYDF